MTTSVYIHIPFCKSLCPYCDFCKLIYDNTLINDYLFHLKKEISNYYKGEKLKTIYIGGGTPSALSLRELRALFTIIDTFKKEKNCEITIELNPESINLKKLLFLKKKVNRLSLGVQTFDDEGLSFLGRKHSKKVTLSKIKMIKEVGFKNISIDLMYGYKNQTLTSLKKDLTIAKKMNVQHISIYNLIAKENTKFFDYVSDTDLDYEMYCLIERELSDFLHYEVSSFAKKGFVSKHNLTYWHNEAYYGFGLGASGYVDGIRYQNSCHFSEYKKLKRVKRQLSYSDKIIDEFIMGLRLLKGISEKKFIAKYGQSFMNFANVIKLINEKKLVFTNGYLKIPKKFIFTSNYILMSLLDNYGGGFDE